VNDETKWISVADAAELLGRSKRTIERWVCSGRLASRLSFQNRREVDRQALMSLREECDDETDTAPPTPQAEKVESESFSGRYVGAAEVKPASDDSPRRDPLGALEHQAERSIQVAGAAFQEAKQLAAAYKDELLSSREVHREEMGRARQQGRLAWGLVMAAIVVICAGIWFAARTDGDRQLQQAEVRHLTEQLHQSEKDLAGAAIEAGRLTAKVESLQAERDRTVEELKAARLGQADAVGQLSAYRTYAEQLAEKAKNLETQLIQAKAERDKEIQLAQAQTAVQAEQGRIVQQRQVEAIRVEQTRSSLMAKAREEQNRREQEQLEARRRQEDYQEAQRRQEIAQVQYNNQPARSDPANLTLTELEQALTRKLR
jgi:hypothetical protein